jgi:ketosteroid isomerase-like protein
MGNWAFTAEEEDDEKAVLKAMGRVYTSANRAEWEEYVSYYAVGCTQFWEAGMIRTMLNSEKSLENMLNFLTEWTENGGKRNIWSRHREVALYGDVAIATCYEHGSFKSPESEREYVLNRVTFVWHKTDDGWKIVHAHYSEMKKDP